MIGFHAKKRREKRGHLLVFDGTNIERTFPFGGFASALWPPVGAPGLRANLTVLFFSFFSFERSFGQAFDRVWSFLNLFSKRPREKKEEGKKEKKEKKKKEEKEEKKDFSYATNFIRISVTL